MPPKLILLGYKFKLFILYKNLRNSIGKDGRNAALRKSDPEKYK
jgi:hypothetical protein